MLTGSAEDIIFPLQLPVVCWQENRQQRKSENEIGEMNHMIRVSQLKLSIPHTKEQLEKKLVRQLHIRPEELISYQIRRQSLDARKKPELFYVYTVDVKVKNEAMLLKHKKGTNVSHIAERPYQVPPHGTEKLNGRPVIV